MDGLICSSKLLIVATKAWFVAHGFSLDALWQQ
jgi:hypothetical protein